MWSDAIRFWGKTPYRTALLVLGCSLVVALLAVNTNLFRNTLWFTPPGVYSHSRFATLGAYSAEGRFETASASDMRALDGLGFRGRYTLYGRDKIDVESGGRTWRDVDVAFVSDEFFKLLDVPVAFGALLGTGGQAIVLDHDFWRTEFGADRTVVGKMLQIAGVSAPIAGVASDQFRGLGDRRPALWLPIRMRGALLQLSIQGSTDVDVAAIKTAIAEQLPTYYAVVALKDPAERERLVDWKVRTTESVSMAASSSARVTVGINRRDFRPAVLDGINLVPAETATITRYLFLLSGLSAMLAILAILNLGAYWSARTAERDDEIQIRHAMGAQLGDLLRLFAGEALPFLFTIALISIPIAWLQSKALQNLEPFHSFLQNRFVRLEVSDFAPSFMAILLIGVAALMAPNVNLFQGSLHSNVLGQTATATRRRVTLVAIQWVMVAAVAGLAGASFLAGYRMKNAGWGGNGNPLLLRLSFSQERLSLLNALGVDPASATTVEVEPLGALSRKYDAYIPGMDAQGRRLALYENVWSPNAIAELGVSLRAGRVYAFHSEGEAMVSESYARALHVTPERLLGRPLARIAEDGRALSPRTIVGVLADVHYSDLRTEPEMVVYVSPEAGNPGAILLLPQSERARIDAALRNAGQHRELTAALGKVTSMNQARDDSARTDALLSFGVFTYALLALALLMLGIIAEARMQLGQRGRELALLVALGARFDQAVLCFLRAPLLIALAAVILILLSVAATRERWLRPFPLLVTNDIWSIGGMIMATVALFGLALATLAAIRLRALSLAEILRVER